MAPDERDRKDLPIPLSHVRERLAGPRGVRRIDALLSAADPAAEVAALSVPEVYQLVKEVGFADAADLVALATPEQLRGCIDLDAWDRDRVQITAMEPWLAAIVEHGFEKLGQVWEQLDPELAALVLARWGRIYDLSLGEAPPEEDDVVYRTPDGFFAISLDPEAGESVKLALAVLEDLYRADLYLARHTLMAARSEPIAELEETSYRWRSGRMADLGYIDYYEALAVFRPLDPSAVRIGEGTQDHVPPPEPGEEARAPGALPVPLAERVVGVSFLARSLDEIRELPELQRLEGALVLLSNQVLAALRIQPGDAEGVRFGHDYAMSTLALGLEIVARGAVVQGAAALRSVAAQRLFRVGLGATTRLAGFAAAVARRAATAGEPVVSLIAALSAERPFFPRELDHPPGAGPRPFESTADLRAAARALTELALRIAVAESLGADLIALAGQPEPRPELAPSGPAYAGPAVGQVELDDFVRTALVRALGGGALDPAPLSPEELAAFRGRAFAGDQLLAEARAAAQAAIDRHLDVAGVTAGRDLVPALLGGWLGQLEQTFGGLPAGATPDARFVAGVITSSQRQ